MAGGHDPDNRRAFRFDRPDEWDRDLLHDVQKMIALRNGRAVLRRGSLTFLRAEGDVAAYLRKLGAESAVMAFNVGSGTERVDLPIGSTSTRDDPRRRLDPRGREGRGRHDPGGRAGPALGEGPGDPGRCRR